MQKVKICFLHQNLVCGGADKALLDLVTLMDKERFDITVFAIQGGGEWEPRFKALNIKVVNPYSELKPPKNLLDKIIYRFKERKIEKIKESGGEGLLDYCCSEQFDIVAAYHINNYCRFAPFVKNKAKTIKFIHGDAGTNPYFKEKMLQAAGYINRFDRIVSDSKVAADSLKELLDISQEVIPCHTPVIAAEIKEMAKEKVDLPKEKYVCSVGRFEREKGFPRLVTVHKMLLDAGLQHKLVIVGEGYEREAIEAEIQRTSTADSVILTGYTANPYPYIQNSMFTVCSSFTEGGHVVSIESLALGVPVASAFPTVTEFFDGEQAGIVTANDNQSLYEGMYKMLSDEEFYKNSLIAAKKRSEYFSSRAMVEKVEKIFYDLLK